MNTAETGASSIALGRLQYSVSKLPWRVRDSPLCISMTFLLARVVPSSTAESVILWHCVDICRCWQSIVSRCGCRVEEHRLCSADGK